MNRKPFLALTVATVLGVASGSAAPDSADVERARSSAAALQSALLTRLQEALRSGGPAAAVTVCRDEAPAIAARVGSERGVELGRTSHNLRNPANAPRDWARSAVEAAAGARAADAVAVQVDLGDRWGFLRPIPTSEACLNCHGPADRLSPEVREAISRDYPSDRATGFTTGDLRGWLWVEVPKGSR